MIKYIVKRLLLIIPTFIGMTMVVSLVTRLAPGGPLEQAIMSYKAQSMSNDGGGSATPSSYSPVDKDSPISAKQMEELRAHYGLDKPWIVAYVHWLWKFIRLDFGESFTYYIPVIELIWKKIPVSAYYGFFTFFLTYLVCIPLGILKAFKHKSLFDTTTSIITFFGFAIPGYVIAIILLVYFGGNLQWFPLGGFMSDDLDLEESSVFTIALDIIYHSILPLISYMASAFAVLTYYMKSYLLDNIAMDYVRTAVAKGVPYRKAVINHAVRNSIIPLASGFSGLLMVFFGGSFLVETIFNIDGLGLFSYQATLNRDFPVIVSMAGIFGVIGLLATLLGDLIVAIVDPRIKFD
ncbi:MAG: ABC transporter permease subunit [Proteobacteria bacterium]|nr:ABC transporter permease subunit [Pseudomonadota bacterium]